MTILIMTVNSNCCNYILEITLQGSLIKYTLCFTKFALIAIIIRINLQLFCPGYLGLGEWNAHDIKLMVLGHSTAVLAAGIK